MAIKPGIYKTRCGNIAIVGQIRSASTEFWLVRGAIVGAGNHKKVYFIHFWDLNGKSRSTDPELDLVL